MTHQTQLTVPITEVPLLEVRTHRELESALRRVYEEGLPGFVIRSAGLVDVSDNEHEALAQAITDILPRVDSPDLFKGKLNYGIINRYKVMENSKPGPGLLHHDGGKANINIHRTEKGKGKVMIANSGRTAGRKPEFFGKDYNQQQSDLNQQLLNGVIDPDQINPVFHSTDLSEGDTVIFPLETSGQSKTIPDHIRGPIWHRFSTMEPRTTYTIDVGRKK